MIKKLEENKKIVSFVLSLISIAFFCVPFFVLPISLFGLLLSMEAQKEKKDSLNIVSFVISLVSLSSGIILNGIYITLYALGYISF